MPRTTLVVQQVSRAGLLPTYATPDVAGSALPNGGQELFHIKTVGTACTVTIQIPGTVDGQAIASKTIVLGTSTERMIGPFPPSIYNQASGEVYIDYSAITAVTVAALRPT